MAYNYGYPVSYNQINPNSYSMNNYPNHPIVAQSYAQQPIPQININSPLIADVVQGEAAAKAYQVPPGKSALLLDAEDETIMYIKTVEYNGMPRPLTYVDLNVRQDANKSSNLSNNRSFDNNSYVSKEEFEELKHQIQNLNSALNNNQRKDRNNGKQSS